MLTHIAIQDFAIVADLALDLGPGMTVLTGETGAGKSILIDALQYALGARADAGMVRHGCERAHITLNFDLSAIPNARVWLDEQGLLSEDDCILRRTISCEGRSKHFINGQLCAQLQVRNLAERLVNIHSQHENQRLLHRDQQQLLLDEFASAQFPKHAQLLQQRQHYFQRWQQTNIDLTTLRNHKDNAAQLILLQYQLAELKNVGLSLHEELQLTAEHKQLANADALIQQCGQTLHLLDDNNPNANDLLTVALKQISPLQGLAPRLKNIFLSLNTAALHLQEAIRGLRHYDEHVEADPARLKAVEQRLRVLHDTARKYKVTPAELPHLEKRLQQELARLEHVDQQAMALEQELANLAMHYQQAAAALSISRIQAAEQLHQAVTKHIRELGMPEGEFNSHFEKQEKVTALSMDRVEFLVRANRGQPLKPLHKIAAGGELSRISLAIQVVTAQSSNRPTLIFDEVDVGIGGATAEMVGKLLRQLSHKTQVLCITHQPQVAAQGSHHLQVNKTLKAGQTVSVMRQLAAKERIEEIARMLGGIEITAQALAHAQEMLGSLNNNFAAKAS